MGVLKRSLRALARVFGVDLVELAAESRTDDPVGALADFDDALRMEVSRPGDECWPALERVAEDYAIGRLVSALDDAGRLESLREHEQLDTGPLRAIEEIDDDSRTVYLHLLEPGADEGAYADRLDKMYREQYGHSPRGMHVPLTELEELQEVDPTYFTQQAAPWLQSADDRGDQVAAAGGDA